MCRLSDSRMAVCHPRRKEVHPLGYHDIAIDAFALLSYVILWGRHLVCRWHVIKRQLELLVNAAKLSQSPMLSLGIELVSGTIWRNFLPPSKVKAPCCHLHCGEIRNRESCSFFRTVWYVGPLGDGIASGPIGPQYSSKPWMVVFLWPSLAAIVVNYWQRKWYRNTQHLWWNLTTYDESKLDNFTPIWPGWTQTTTSWCIHGEHFLSLASYSKM